VAVVCKECHWCAKHVGGVNLWANTGLFGVKLAGGIFGSSQALIADAVHSLSDIIIAILVIVSLKVSSAPPDEDHHWGHGSVEFIVSIIIGVLLVCTAVTITVVSLTSIAQGVVYNPGILAIWAATISIVANEVMFKHSLCIGRQMESPTMLANAWENRADVYSSLAAFIGVFGALLGFKILDPLAAIVVGFMIAQNGITTLISGFKGITDSSFDREMLERVKKLVLKAKGVRDVGRLRARKIGQKNWVDIEAKFDPKIKVADVKKILNHIKMDIMNEFDKIGDVIIVSRALEPGPKEI